MDYVKILTKRKASWYEGQESICGDIQVDTCCLNSKGDICKGDFLNIYIRNVLSNETLENKKSLLYVDRADIRDDNKVDSLEEEMTNGLFEVSKGLDRGQTDGSLFDIQEDFVLICRSQADMDIACIKSFWGKVLDGEMDFSIGDYGYFEVDVGVFHSIFFGASNLQRTIKNCQDCIKEEKF